MTRTHRPLARAVAGTTLALVVSLAAACTSSDDATDDASPTPSQAPPALAPPGPTGTRTGAEIRVVVDGGVAAGADGSTSLPVEVAGDVYDLADPEGTDEMRATLEDGRCEDEPADLRPDASSYLLACDDVAAYLLGPAAVADAVETAEAAADAGQVSIAVTLSDAADDTFTTLTTVLSQQGGDRQIAIVVDGRIVSAPTVLSPIDGGELQITGTFSLAEAEDLAARMTAS